MEGIIITTEDGVIYNKFGSGNGYDFTVTQRYWEEVDALFISEPSISPECKRKKELVKSIPSAIQPKTKRAMSLLVIEEDSIYMLSDSAAPPYRCNLLTIKQSRYEPKGIPCYTSVFVNGDRQTCAYFSILREKGLPITNENVLDAIDVNHKGSNRDRFQVYTYEELYDLYSKLKNEYLENKALFYKEQD